MDLSGLIQKILINIYKHLKSYLLLTELDRQIITDENDYDICLKIRVREDILLSNKNTLN